MKYEELLKDPRWQRKRLEIMQRDNFTCQKCGCNDKPLNVHHLYYNKNKKPWEYDNSSLITLCEDCHREKHNIHVNTNNKMIKSAMGKKVFFRGLQKENRLSPKEKIVLSYILTHNTENRSEIARCLSMSRKTVVDAMNKINELGFLENKENIMQHGYFELINAECLTGELLIFYSFLLDKARKYNNVIDTNKYKLADIFDKRKDKGKNKKQPIAITKLLHRLYVKKLAERLKNGKLLIKHVENEKQ